jgi:hypothetical protein
MKMKKPPTIPAGAQICSFDCESYLIQPGLMFPKVVCWSVVFGNYQGEILQQHVYSAEIGAKLIQTALAAGLKMVAHYAAFDVAANINLTSTLENAKAWFDAYENGQVACTKVREKMHDIARGYKFKPCPHTGKPRIVDPRLYSLKTLAWDYLKILVDGKDGADAWRLRYSELDGIPPEKWPLAAYSYSLLDSVYAFQVFLAQENRFGTPANCEFQQRADLAATFMSAWGLRSDPERVALFENYLENKMSTLWEELEKVKIMVPSGVTKKPVDAQGRNALLSYNKLTGKPTIDQGVLGHLVSVSFGGSPPLTDTGRPKTDSETLSVCNHPALQLLAESQSAKHRINTYLPPLKQGVTVPINPQYDVCKDTGRFSSFNPNIQNQPRNGAVRPCYVSRPGYVFCNLDYDQIELCVLANTLFDWFGSSAMADALRNARDLHSDFALEILAAETGQRISYEDFVSCLKGKFGKEWKDKAKFYRQLAKVCNFGFPGGLGAATFVTYAVGYGVTVTEDMARKLKRLWQTKWPEMTLYFARIGAMIVEGIGATIVQPYSERVRGQTDYCAACNQFFQGGAADGAKQALWEMIVACFTNPLSPLFGSRVVFAVHDEFMLEIPDKSPAFRHAAAYEAKKIMISGMQKFCPHVPVSCDPVLIRHWYKNAEQVFDSEGLLDVWHSPIEYDPKTLEETK